MTTVYATKDRAIAVQALAQYQALAKKLTDEWGIGASVLKKYNIEPYLKRQKAFEDALVKFTDLRKKYNDLSKQVADGRSNPEFPQERLSALEQQWGEFGVQIQKLGDGQLQDIGGKFKKNLDDFQTTLTKLVTNLRTVQTKTQKQRDDLVKLLQFVKSTHTNVVNLANEDFDFVQGAVDKAKAKVPIT